MIIIADVERLRMVGRSIRTVNNELENCMYQIEQVMQSTGHEWKGDAEIAHEAKLLFVKKQYEKINNFFMAYADLVDKTADEYEEWEAKLVYSIQNI